MRAIIVEDSRLARQELLRLLEPFKQIEVVAEVGEPEKAIKIINELTPDLLFLDIQMPGKNGFELLDAIEFKPQVIFITAYDEYALRSFDYDAVDYLLKPVETSRLKDSINKLDTNGANDFRSIVRLSESCSVFIKDSDRCWFVELPRIYRLESCGNYTKVYFEENKPLLHKSLNQIEKRLPESMFFRANRQSIINLKFIVSVELGINSNLIVKLKSGCEIEVSRRNSARFKQLLSL